MRSFEALIQSNQEFLSSWSTKKPEPSEVKKLGSEGQKPEYAILTCADSRVVPEVIFHKTVGELFVIRTAGNTVHDESVASLEFAVDQLKVKNILILEHTQCGAIGAAQSVSKAGDKGLTPALKELVKNILPFLQNSTDHKCFSEYCAETLLERSPLIRERFVSGEISIAHGIYSIETGQVQIEELTQKESA